MTARGAAWEAVCVEALQWQAARGTLFWLRTGAEVRQIGDSDETGAFKAARVKKGPPDFFVMAAGMAILGDFKETRKATWPFSSLEEHQAKDLDAHQRQGGVSVLLLRFLPAKGRPATFVVLWRLLGPLWWRWSRGSVARGEGSLSREVAAEVGTAYEGLEWLNSLRAHLARAETIC